MDEKVLKNPPVVSKKDNKKHGSLKRNRIVGNTLIYTILCIICVVWIVPFILILIQSFNVDWKVAADAVGEDVKGGGVVSYLWPEHWGFNNYINLFKRTDFGRWYLITFLVALATAVIQTVMVLVMAYTLSRLRFSGRKFLMNFMLILGMFPGFLTMIVLYNILSDMGLTGSGTIGGLILVYTASSGMGYYVSKGFFDTIPKSLDEAARVDGANRAQVMTKVILPLSKPIVIYTVLTAFMGPWADFMFARYISLGDDMNYNVAVGLQQFLTGDQLSYSYTLFCAGGVLVAIPVTILFMCLQKYYVEGVTGGAVKG